MSNISVEIIGFYQCKTIASARLLKIVFNALLVSIMIILPWFVVFMLTTVLHLTMSEEQYGQCSQCENNPVTDSQDAPLAAESLEQEIHSGPMHTAKSPTI